MLRIAICDDETRQRRLTEGLLRDYLALRPGVEAETSAFSSAAALLTKVRQGEVFDLCLLDVIMPGQDGISLGVALRECDRDMVIIYLTTSPDFAVDSYLARAFHYLLKPLDRERLFAVLDAAVQKLTDGRDAAISLKTREGARRLLLGSIVYGELSEGCVCYHLADGSAITGVTLRRSFKDAVGELLTHPRFTMCGASCVVNLSFVEGIERDGVRLKGGGCLPLPRTFRVQVTDRWMDHCLGEARTQC